MSVWQIDLDNVLTKIVEAMLPRFSPQNEGLLVTLDARMYIYSDDGESDCDVSKMFHVLYNRPNNYTKVFVAMNDSWFINDIKPEDWDNTSDHDSCWTTDGIRPLTRAYAEMRTHIQPDRWAPRPSIFCRVNNIHRVTLELESFKDESKYRRQYRPLNIKFVD